MIHVYISVWPMFSDGVGRPKEKARHRTGVLLGRQECQITQRQVMRDFDVNSVLLLNRIVLVHPFSPVSCKM